LTLGQVLRWNRRARPDLPPGAAAVDLAEAETFLRAFYHENPGGPVSLTARLGEVRAQVDAAGTYEHTPAELAWACKAAWRHSARCSGRDKWRTVKLRDRRQVADPAGVAAESVAHLRHVSEGGRIRSVITVFAPDVPARRGPRIINGQVIRYAGHRRPNGGFVGDPLNARLTDLAIRLGWEGAGTAFDVLPLIVAGPDGRPRMFAIPPDAVLEVPISHPDHAWFAQLDLKWHAVPLISDMLLDAGGLRYPCIFNGWYQADSEIGARNLGDADRYDMLPAVAAGLGLDTSRLSTLWRVRAVAELAYAVQRSFEACRVMATDHQTEMDLFMRFVSAEEAAGRPWCADWAWIVPPVGGSTTPAFHRTYPNPDLRPGFIREDTAGCPAA
jgi:nitric-oxide synthase, bacterial